ncbi:hypothetical protein BDZ91DRAFT_721378 [Kalaharituber pfeilii]|nr:hypothetical protein BDZ91DRAFT_721378 [Kalaharituber pfeilii]
MIPPSPHSLSTLSAKCFTLSSSAHPTLLFWFYATTQQVSDLETTCFGDKPPAGLATGFKCQRRGRDDVAGTMLDFTGAVGKFGGPRGRDPGNADGVAGGSVCERPGGGGRSWICWSGVGAVEGVIGVSLVEE